MPPPGYYQPPPPAYGYGPPPPAYGGGPPPPPYYQGGYPQQPTYPQVHILFVHWEYSCLSCWGEWYNAWVMRVESSSYYQGG